MNEETYAVVRPEYINAKIYNGSGTTEAVVASHHTSLLNENNTFTAYSSLNWSQFKMECLHTSTVNKCGSVSSGEIYAEIKNHV